MCGLCDCVRNRDAAHTYLSDYNVSSIMSILAGLGVVVVLPVPIKLVFNVFL